MKNLFNGLAKKRHYLVIEAENVLEVIDTINSHYSWYVNYDLEVGNCALAKDRNKWFVHFNASGKQWAQIVATLNNKGYTLVIKSNPRDVHVIKERES